VASWTGRQMPIVKRVGCIQCNHVSVPRRVEHCGLNVWLGCLGSTRSLWRSPAWCEQAQRAATSPFPYWCAGFVAESIHIRWENRNEWSHGAPVSYLGTNPQPIIHVSPISSADASGTRIVLCRCVSHSATLNMSI